MTIGIIIISTVVVVVARGGGAAVLQNAITIQQKVLASDRNKREGVRGSSRSTRGTPTSLQCKDRYTETMAG